jgi:hypothetical protein
MKQVRDLVNGRIDFHIHPGFDPFARVLDSYEISWLAERYGMKAIVFKTSNYQGGCVADMLNKEFHSLNIVGGICLEKVVGGFNPRAVDMALQCGCKVVWMPFLDAKHNTELWNPEIQDMSPGDYIMMKDLSTSRSDHRTERLNITIDGKLVSGVEECLRLIAEHDAVACSGHMNAADRKIFVKAAKEAGVKKIVLTHVNALQARASYDELEGWKKEKDVICELVFNPVVPYFSNQDPDVITKMIKLLGPEKCVIGTDLGISQAFKGIAWPSPLEGMAAFIGMLETQGFSDKDIDTVSIDTGSYLLGL